jgi:hypothetical protein
MPVASDVLREVSVPALGSTDGVRIQAVENEANAHENALRRFTDR